MPKRTPPARRTHLRWIIPMGLIAIAAAGLFYAGVVFRYRQKPVPQATGLAAVNVSVEPVRRLASIADALVQPAVVEPSRVVDVAAEVSSHITAIHCTEGNTCKKDEVLISLNTDLLQAEHDRAGAQARFDAREHKRFQSLTAGGAATEKQADEARSRMEISRANLALAQARLERARITAPINGILNRIPVEKGEYVQPGTRVAQIVDIETAKIVVNMPEPDIQYFRKGDTATVMFSNSDTERTRAGVISYISELSDARTRVTRVEITVKNHDHALRSGQVVRARLTRRVLKDVIMVPLLAIIPLDKGYRVYVVKDNVARARSITTAWFIRKDAHGVDRVRVLEGLNPGDSLIVAGHRLVGDGQKVHIVRGDPEAVDPAQAAGKLGR